MNLDIQDFLPAISKVVRPEPQPWDIAMEDFRRAFRLVAECKVTPDGKLMIYQLKTVSNMTTWLACANSAIITHKLPLVAKIRSVMKGREAVTVQLRIVYKP